MDYTRVTVHGSRRRADLVIPDDESLGTVLPRLADLLDEPVDPPIVIATVDGRLLDLERTPAEQGVLHGDLLRLVPADRAPRPPEVSDITAVVERERSDRRDLWTLGRARAGATVVVAALAALACGQVALLSSPAVVVGAVLLVVLAAVVAWRTTTWVRGVATAAALGWTAVLGAGLAAPPDTPVLRLLWQVPFGVLTAAWLVVAVVLGLFGRTRALLVAGLVGAVASVPFALLPGGVRPEQVAAILGPLGVLALGVVPTLALAASGLSGLDDLAVAGRPLAPATVSRGVRDAYGALLWVVVALALPLAASVAALAAAPGAFARWLALALVVVVVARARLFPLVGQVLAVGAVVAAGLASLLADPVLPVWGRLALLAGTASAVLVAVATDRPEHVRARVRTWANTLELIAVVAIVPLVLAHFGVFADLLAVFRR